MDFSKLAGRARKLAETARENIEQASREGELGPLAGRARDLVRASRERLAALASGTGREDLRDRAAQILEDTAVKVRSATTRESFARYRTRATELLDSTRQEAKEMSDRTAGSIARFYTEKTGKEVSPEQVKSVAMKVGAALVVAATLSAMMEAGSGGDGELGGSGADDRADGFGNSFEGDMHRFFADKGGLNIETQVVDGDGVILS